MDRIVIINKHNRSDLIDLLQKKYLVQEIRLKSLFSSEILSKKQIVIDILLNTVKLLFLLDKKSKLYVSTDATNAFPILILNKVLRKKIVLTNFYLHAWGNKKIIKIFLKIFLDSHVSMAVQSEYEKKYYSEFISSDRIQYIPYCLDISLELDVQVFILVFKINKLKSMKFRILELIYAISNSINHKSLIYNKHKSSAI
jgi:hypothetical protein